MSLAKHQKECAERYAGIEARFGRIEAKLDRLMWVIVGLAVAGGAFDKIFS